MATRIGTAYVPVEGDWSKFNREMRSQTRGFTRRMGQLGVAGGVVLGAAVAKGAKEAIGAASDLNESINKTRATFEKSSPAIQKWSKSTSDALGLSRQAALDAAGSIGAMLKPMGVAPRAASQMSKRMVQLAADMASFNNEDPTEMLDRIRAGLSGESEPLKRFGTVLSETRVKTHAWKVGIAEAGAELTEQQKIMGRYSLLLKDTSDQHGDFARTSDGLANVQRRLKANIQDVAAGIGQQMLPAAEKAAQVVNDLAGEISDVVNRKDLDFGEKLAGSFDVTQKRLRPFVRDVAEVLEDANVGERLADAVETAIPKIADAAAKAAPRAAGAFVTGFIDAGPWGRLAIAGLLLKKMGGLGAFRGIGGQAGAAMATGVATSPSWRSRATQIGKGFAIGAAVAFGPEFIKRAGKDLQSTTGGDFELPKNVFAPLVGELGPLKDLQKGILSVLEPSRQRLRDFGETAEETAEKLNKAGDYEGLRRLTNQAREFAQDFPKHSKELNRFADTTESMARRIHNAMSRKWAQQIGDNWKHLENSGTSSLQAIRSTTDRNMQLIKDRMGTDSDAGKRAMSKNFRLAAKAVREQMEDGTISTKKGTGLIRQYLIEGLEALGLTGEQARNKLKTGTLGSKGDLSQGIPRGVQRGGSIHGGKPTGDSIPAVLERGEYVLNRRAVQKLGRDQLDRLNFGIAPRFQQGGIVALGKRLQKEGFHVSEHPAFGGVKYRHAENSFHYRGQALDINADHFPGGEAAALDRLYARLRKMSGISELLWRVADHFDHLHVAMSGAGGGLPGAALKVPKLKGVLTTMGGGPGAMLNRGFAVTRDAAQQVMRRVAGTIPVEGAEPGAASSGGAGAFGKEALKKLWVRAGGDPSNANLMAAIALAESGGRPGVTGPPDGRGLWQIEWPVWADTMRGLGLHDAFDPVQNARMARHVLKTQGLGAWVAYSRGMHRQFLQRGGLAGRLGKVLRPLKSGKTIRLRKQQMRALLGKVAKVDIPKGLKDRLKTHGDQAAIFGDYAARAGLLGSDDQPGSYQGLSEADWLTRQLAEVFQYRNALIEAEEEAKRRREEIRQLIEQARGRLQQVMAVIARSRAIRNQLARQLNKAQKHPKRNKDAIKDLKGRIRAIDQTQKSNGSIRDAIKDRVLPALTGQRTDLRDFIRDTGDNIDDVQGLGSTRKVLPTLPGIGQLGGTILDLQSTIAGLTAEPPTIRDPEAGSTDRSQRESLLEEELRKANLRAEVSERHFQVFKNLPPFGGSFATGGVVPGPEGAARTAIVHAGETITPVGGDGPRVRVVVEDHRTRVYVDEVEQIVERRMRREARAGARVLPGRSGGGI